MSWWPRTTASPSPKRAPAAKTRCWTRWGCAGPREDDETPLAGRLARDLGAGLFFFGRAPKRRQIVADAEDHHVELAECAPDQSAGQHDQQTADQPRHDHQQR